MNNQIFWVLDLAVKEGRLNDFRALMGEMSQSTRANEQGCLNYEWFISEDETTCSLYERYADSDALMTHLGNFGAHFADRFMSCVDITKFVVFGEPNEIAREALGSLGVAFMNPFGGFKR